MKSEWIKTSEQLPEDQQEVWALTIHGAGHFEYRPEYKHFWAVIDHVGGYDVEADSYTISEVPYWMPLPELPEEVK